MATQMGYGQFFDILEEMNFTVDNGNTEDQTVNVNKKIAVSEQLLSGDDNQRTRIISHFFKTMEQLNLSQNESTDSLRSGLSCSNISRRSSSSFKRSSSLSSVASEKEDTATKFVNAVQSLTLNNYGSTNSLNSLDEADEVTKTKLQSLMKLFLPGFMENFINTFDEFMHNHEIAQQNQDDSNDPAEQQENENVFPKLC